MSICLWVVWILHGNELRPWCRGTPWTSCELDTSPDTPRYRNGDEWKTTVRKRAKVYQGYVDKTVALSDVLADKKLNVTTVMYPHKIFINVLIVVQYIYIYICIYITVCHSKIYMLDICIYSIYPYTCRTTALLAIQIHIYVWMYILCHFMKNDLHIFIYSIYIYIYIYIYILVYYYTIISLVTLQGHQMSVMKFQIIGHSAVCCKACSG